MPGRLRRRCCLKPRQPRSASPRAWGPATRHRDPVRRDDQQLAQPCADLPEGTYLIGYNPETHNGSGRAILLQDEPNRL